MKQTQHNESVLGKFVESLSTMVEGTLNAPRRNTFRARPSVSRINGREQCRHTERRTGRQKKNKFAHLQDLQISATLEETFLEGCLKTTGHMPPRAEPIEETEKEKHARLPAQTPASRVSKNPGGNNRQERMNAVRPRGQETSSRQRVGKTTKKKRRATLHRN